MVFVDDVAVRQVDAPPALGQHGIVREDRELEHHLVDLAVAVAADAEELGPRAD